MKKRKEHKSLIPLIVLLLTFLMFSCQKTQTKKSTDDKEQVSAEGFYNNLVNQIKPSWYPDTIIYNDYGHIIQNIKKLDKKSKYYKKEYMDTLALMNPTFFKKLRINHPTIDKELGIDSYNILAVLDKYQNTASSSIVKYKNLKEIFENRANFDNVFGELVKGLKITERELNVTIYDNRIAIFNIYDSSGYIGYWVILDKNTIKITPVSYLEE